jgi:hypothetical protein
MSKGLTLGIIMLAATLVVTTALSMNTVFAGSGKDFSPGQEAQVGGGSAADFSPGHEKS